MMRYLFSLIILLPSLCFAGAPSVVVTLKPIHSLAALVMENVGSPELLLPDGASPHTYQMKPSNLKQLSQADLIIWVGPSLENFMSKGMKAIQPPQTLLTLSEFPKMKYLPQRHDREWSDHDHDHDHMHAHDGKDPHLWLSTENAAIIIDAISEALSQKDPEHAAIYQKNASVGKAKLKALHQNLQTELMPYHEVPFLVYHDGYQYFEKEYDLNAKGTVLINPHLPLSAYGLKKLQEQVKSQNIQCVFRETEFNDKLIQEGLKGFNVRIQELEPFGVRFPAGPENYFQTM